VQHFDVAIIGGGSGLTAATFALEDGKSVALIDARPDALGGTCVNRGCLPTKQLIQTAGAMEAIRRAGNFGVSVDVGGATVDFPGIMEAMRAKRRERAAGVRKWVESEMTPFYGRATFVDDRVIEMDSGERIRVERVFLAVGASPAIPPIEGLDGVDYLTNRSVLELTEQPKRLVILGGGYIGCEFAHFFHGIGTEVVLIDTSEHCLLKEDHEVSELFTRGLGKRVELCMGSRAVGVRRAGTGVELTVRGTGGERTIAGDALLIATGRTPNTKGLGLEATGVEVDERGWVRVDDHLRTANANVYAYGDCIGREMFKHTSSYDGELAYRTSQRADRAVDYRANPHAVFTDPELASVGLTERACSEQGLDYRAATVPYAGIAKGEIIGSPPGLAKAVVEAGTGRILGMHLAGPHSAILIQEVVIAMAHGLTAQAICDAIHIHPSMPELIQTVFRKLC